MLFLALCVPAESFHRDSYFLWKKYGFANFEIDTMAHMLLFPVAIADLNLLRPFYYNSQPSNYMLYSLPDVWNFHVVFACFIPAYYTVLMLANHAVTGFFPYDIIYAVHRRGVIKGWAPFLIMVCSFISLLCWSVTYFTPQDWHYEPGLDFIYRR